VCQRKCPGKLFLGGRNRQTHRRAGLGFAAYAVALGLIYLSSTPAQALPSFARQTGKPCAQCHNVAYGVALTAYGRQFKLNGYVWGDAKQVIPPVALMAQGGFTRTPRRIRSTSPLRTSPPTTTCRWIR